MTDLFDLSLHRLGQNSQDVFVVSIGAMDGVMFDEICGYVTMYGFKGLYVEPIPYLFEKLVKNLSGAASIFENCAISDFDGEIEMVMINREPIDQGLIHPCFYGMSAVWPPRNGLGSESDRTTLETYGQKITVPCMRLATLWAKHCVTHVDVIKMDAEGHDYQIFQQINLESECRPKVIRLEWINLSDLERNSVLETFQRHDYLSEICGSDITAVDRRWWTSRLNPQKFRGSTVTLVTGLWDLGRETLDGSWSITFTNYLERFRQLLQIDCHLIIFGDNSLETEVWKYRSLLRPKTQFIVRTSDWFRKNEYYQMIQKIRTTPDWQQQNGWLAGSPQAALEMYNPIVMSKMFLLNDARILDQFQSDYLFWIDAGISATVHPGYFTHDQVLTQLPEIVDRFTFIVFPYQTQSEIHGFNYRALCQYAENCEVAKVARGGFFGGPKVTVAQINAIYYNLLMSTLSNGHMGTEESLFSIMVYKYPELIAHFDIEGDGLLFRFFERLKVKKQL
jgi:FkbM family methyltransferase